MSAGIPAADGWDEIHETFHRCYGAAPAIGVRAPGRINLIGEHTDYNDGFVLPAAVDLYVAVAAQVWGEPLIRIRSLQFSGETVFSTRAPEDAHVPPWGRYAQGVAAGLRAAGIALVGVEAVIGGDLPAGAGLSSSAALAVAAALTLLAAAGRRLPPRQIAQLARRAEEEYAGVRCGIMDQIAVTMGRPGHALLLDCRSLEIAPAPLPEDVALVLCDTGVRRDLEASAYNRRRGECEAALIHLRRRRPAITSLRDATPEDLVEAQSGMPDVLHRRARHVITENARVLDMAQALRRADFDTVDRTMAASHTSLRDDFEVSIPALDAMAAAAAAAPGCLGARLTGAGFGGSVVALVRRDVLERFLSAAASAYRAAAGREGTFTACRAASGAEVLTGAPGETS